MKEHTSKTKHVRSSGRTVQATICTTKNPRWYPRVYLYEENSITHKPRTHTGSRIMSNFNIAQRFNMANKEINDMKAAIDKLYTFIHKEQVENASAPQPDLKILASTHHIKAVIAMHVVEHPHNITDCVRSLHVLKILEMFLQTTADTVPWQAFVDILKNAVQRADLDGLSPTEIIQGILTGDIA